MINFAFVKAKLELGGMHFHSFIGCLEAEKAMGNDFVVDFSAMLEIGEAAASDRLEDALDYSLIYNRVAEEMAKPCNLIENAAGRILDSVCAAFPQLEDVVIRVSKKNPPVSGPVEYSSITISR